MDSPEGCLFFACILWECAGCKEAVPDFSAAPCHTVATHFQWRETVNALELPDVHGRGVVLSLESHAKCRLVGNINADLIALEKKDSLEDHALSQSRKRDNISKRLPGRIHVIFHGAI